MAIIQTKFGRFSQISEMKYKTLTTIFLGPGEFWHNGNPKKKNHHLYKGILWGKKKGPKLPYIFMTRNTGNQIQKKSGKLFCSLLAH